MRGYSHWIWPHTLRQTELGASREGNLTILRWPHTASTDYGEKPLKKIDAFVLKLPDELLSNIVDLATLDGHASRAESCRAEIICDRKTLFALVLSCQRLCRIAKPMLWHTIDCGSPHRAVPPSRAAKRVHRALCLNPSLGQYCRALCVRIADLGPNECDFSIIDVFVECLPHVQCLRIHGGFEKHNQRTWEFVQKATRRMRKIRHLSISRECFSLYLKQIFALIDTTCLEKLEIHGISASEDSVPLLDIEKHRTANITSLAFSDYEESPSAMVQLLCWPKSLAHFRLGSYYHNKFEADLPMFYDMLQVHKDTLKTIDIGYLSGSGRGKMFNASDFPHLEKLSLSRWEMSVALNETMDDISRLLGPKLQYFGWDFSIYDQHSESWSDFGEREASWMRRLASAAITSQAALKNIHITFNPDIWDSSLIDTYPWNLMERIKSEIEPEGLVLTYSGPSVTKRVWLDHLQWQSGEGEPVERAPSEELEQGSSTGSMEGRSSIVEFEEACCIDGSSFQGRDIREYFHATARSSIL